MGETYFELCIKPSDFYEIFVSEILDFTGAAVEEIAEVVEAAEATEAPGTPEGALGEGATRKSRGAVIVRTETEPSALLAHLEGLSRHLSAINGIEVGFSHTIEKKQNRDYIQAYKDSVSALDCGVFHIYPPWLSPKDSAINIILEPSLAFGTGHHESTFMCLEALQSKPILSRLKSGARLLDVGCGSGILALCAANLGGKVSLCDVDILAIEEAKKNFARNGAKMERIWLVEDSRGESCGGAEDSGCFGESHADFADSKVSRRFSESGKSRESCHSRAPQTFDIITANITADVLVELSQSLKSSLKSGGILVLSGILSDLAPSVKAAFCDLDIVEEKSRNEWSALVLASSQISARASSRAHGSRVAAERIRAPQDSQFAGFAPKDSQ